MVEVKKDDTIAVWFSCGAASAVAAKLTLDAYRDKCNVIVVNNPVLEEHYDNLRFLNDVEKWLDVDIQYATHYKFPHCSTYDVWEVQNFMAGVYGAPCTDFLKKRARQHFEKHFKRRTGNEISFHVLGFTSEEKHRHERFVLGERSNVIPVLIDADIDKNECMRILTQEAKIEIPAIYHDGFPNANCIGCVKARSATMWNHIRKTYPEIYQDRIEQEKVTNSKLIRYKGEDITLASLTPDMMSRPLVELQNLHVECGIFCEEKF